MTKSGEDVWDDSWDDNDYSNWNLNDFEDLGSGIFTDGEGNYYIDIDYDGDFDLVTIAPGYVEDEEPEDPNIPNPEPDEEEDNEDENDGDDDWNTEGLSEEQCIDNIKTRLISALGDAIGSVKVGLTIEIGTPANSQFSEIVSLTTSDLFEKNHDYTILIVSGLNDIKQKLVLAHEFMHLKLFEISQDAGSASELGRSNPELSGIINLYHADKDNNLYWLNDAHHFYMGQHVEEMEQLLREAFPGMDEEFYEYGKWGGGAHASDVFRGLSFDEKTMIATYLVSIGLLNE